MLKHNCRILLVEDHPFQLKATLCLLETYGFTHITTADNAANALQQMQLAVHPFELLLCDQHLPDNPGLELIQIAHQAGFIEYAILLSCLGITELDELKKTAHAQRLPLLGCLPKPLKHSELILLLTPLHDTIQTS